MSSKLLLVECDSSNSLILLKCPILSTKGSLLDSGSTSIYDLYGILFIESTYGNKEHEDIATRTERLNAIIDHALQDGGVILIPAFSVGRTQELLFDIEQLIHQRDLSSSLPIILDSPLAKRVTKTYRRFKKLWGKEAKQKLNNHRPPSPLNNALLWKAIENIKH